jgi:hypothetical protein
MLMILLTVSVEGSVGSVCGWPLYIPHSATHLAACHRPSGVSLNGTSATSPRNISKEVVKPVRSDEDAQMVAPIRFDCDSRSHSHILTAEFRIETCVPSGSGSPPRRWGLTKASYMNGMIQQTNSTIVSSPLPLQLPFPHFPLPSLLIPIPVLGSIFIFNPSILPNFPSRSFTHHPLCGLQLGCSYTELLDPAEERRKFRKEVHAV